MKINRTGTYILVCIWAAVILSVFLTAMSTWVLRNFVDVSTNLSLTMFGLYIIVISLLLVCIEEN